MQPMPDVKRCCRLCQLSAEKRNSIGLTAMSPKVARSLILRTDCVGTVLHFRRPIIPTGFAE